MLYHGHSSCSQYPWGDRQFWDTAAVVRLQSQRALGQPEESVFIWVVLIALLFSGINGMTMFLIGKGLMRAVQVHLTLAVMSLVLTTVYLLTALSGASVPGVSLIAALISIFMLLLSGYCIHSTSFYKMLLFTLHNRALRKLLHQTRKT